MLRGTRCLLFAAVWTALAGRRCSANSDDAVGGEAGVRRRELAAEEKGGDAGKRPPDDEAKSIQPIDLPFVQTRDGWEQTGISLTVSGEPKSGTTWVSRITLELCLQLCGSSNNSWCKMGGLTVKPSAPAPVYEYEMLHAETGDLYVHYQSRKSKHKIPGTEVSGACAPPTYAGNHAENFGTYYPCKGTGDSTRETLSACLPDYKSPDCVPFLPPLDPALRRMAVVFRDPRNLVISEYRMKLTYFRSKVEKIGTLEPFILHRFKTIVAWQYIRWVWHTTALKDVSHVMFYEDLQAHPRYLADLAAFLGLECTAEQADDVWQRHVYTNPPGDYTTFDLSDSTLKWMNTTMAILLPEAMVDRYGLTPNHPKVVDGETVWNRAGQNWLGGM